MRLTFGRRRARIFLVALALATPSHAAEKLRLLATFAPIYSFASNVAGDAAEVEMLLPAIASPHDFALAPGDLGKFARADVIVCNGLGLESWLEKAMSSAGKKGALRIDASKAIPAAELPADDPHVWLNPLHAISEVRTIAEELAARDSSQAEIYRANASAYIAQLQKLDAAIFTAAQKMPNKNIVTLHRSFADFAQRYGFAIVGTIEDSPGRSPAPQELRALRRVITEKKVRVIFSEPEGSSPQLRRLADDLHVRIAVLDPIESGAPARDLYLRAMEKNLEVLRQELRGDE